MEQRAFSFPQNPKIPIFCVFHSCISIKLCIPIVPHQFCASPDPQQLILCLQPDRNSAHSTTYLHLAALHSSAPPIAVEVHYPLTKPGASAAPGVLYPIPPNPRAFFPLVH